MSITIKNLSFAYDNSDRLIFDNVNLEINTQWKLGLTGKNGQGKTTLLNILQGKLDYTGTVFHQEDLAYFPYFIDNQDDYAIDVIRKIAPDCEDWQIYKEMDAIDLNDEVLYRSYRTLSEGEKTKTQLLGLFLKEHQFLLIDEPTNHLDLDSRHKLADYLNKKSGFILISHDRQFLDRCVDHILSINNTTIDIIQGNFSTWWENKQRQDQFEMTQNEKLKKDIKRVQEASRRTASWSDKVESTKNGVKSSGLKVDKGYVGHKSAKMMQRSKNLQRRQQEMIQDKSELLKDVDEVETLKLSPRMIPNHKNMMLKNVRVIYDNHFVTPPINFTFKQGDRVALKGSNGSGKSSIIKLIMGKDIAYEGEIEMSQLSISYVSQDVTEVKGAMDDYIYNYDIDKTQFFTLLRKLGFSRADLAVELNQLSMGQKKKIMIARSLCESCELYIWDEPLNYIDVLTRMQIETVILSAKPNLIFVEHDEEFVKRIATQIVSFDVI